MWSCVWELCLLTNTPRFRKSKAVIAETCSLGQGRHFYCSLTCVRLWFQEEGLNPRISFCRSPKAASALLAAETWILQEFSSWILTQ